MFGRKVVKNYKIISIILLAVLIIEFFPNPAEAWTYYTGLDGLNYNLERELGSQIQTPGNLILDRNRREGSGSRLTERALVPPAESSPLQSAVFAEKIFSGKLNDDGLKIESRTGAGRQSYIFAYYPSDSQMQAATNTLIKPNFIELNELGIKVQLERAQGGVKYTLIPSYRGELFGLAMKKIVSGSGRTSDYYWTNSLSKFANVKIKQSDIDSWANNNSRIISPFTSNGQTKVLAIYEKSRVESSCPLIGNCDNWYYYDGYAIAADGRLGEKHTGQNHPSGWQIGGFSLEQVLKIAIPAVIYIVAPYIAPAGSTLPTHGGMFIGESHPLKTSPKFVNKIIPAAYAQTNSVKEIELSTNDANNILNQIGSQFLAPVVTDATPFGTVESLGSDWGWSGRKLTSIDIGERCGNGAINQVSEQCEPPNTTTCDSNCKIITGVSGVIPDAGATIGTIRLNARLDGKPWSGSLNLQTEEPYVAGCYDKGTLIGATSQKACAYSLDYSVPQVFSDLPFGVYKITGVSGGPAGASLDTSLPYSQTLGSGGSLEYTLDFKSTPQGTPTPEGTPAPVSTSCGSLTFPSAYWHEIYTVHSNGQCLGEHKEDARWDFDVDWGNGTIDFGKGDDVELNMGRIRNVSAGTYKFTLGSDDGTRLYIDGDLCADNWGDHGYQEKDCSKSLSLGDHSFWIKYYENGGGARIRFKTETVSLAPPPPPPPPPPPSFSISSNPSVGLTILGKGPETCASGEKNNTSLITVESFNGFNENVSFSITDWGGLDNYLVVGGTYPQGFNFSRDPLASGFYESGSVFNVCVKPNTPKDQYTLKLRGRSPNRGDRYTDIFINTLLKDPKWREI